MLGSKAEELLLINKLPAAGVQAPVPRPVHTRVDADRQEGHLPHVPGKGGHACHLLGSALGDSQHLLVSFGSLVSGVKRGACILLELASLSTPSRHGHEPGTKQVHMRATAFRPPLSGAAALTPAPHAASAGSSLGCCRSRVLKTLYMDITPLAGCP